MENGEVKKHIKRAREYGTYPVFEGMHPPLVSQELFLQAQEIRREKQPGPKVKKTAQLQNAFAGLMFCGICGKRVGRTVGAAADSELIPRAEALLASYEQMTVRERNDLLKGILHRIEYTRGAEGRIVIDLYPRLPRAQGEGWHHGGTHVYLSFPSQRTQMQPHPQNSAVQLIWLYSAVCGSIRRFK